MAFCTPMEIPHSGHRLWAWFLYVLLLLAYAVYTGFVFYLAQRSKHHPPVSLEYLFHDVVLPDVYVCPELFNADYQGLQAANVSVGCLIYDSVGLQAVGGGGISSISGGTRMPLPNLGPFAGGESYFSYSLINSSNCLVEAVVLPIPSILGGKVGNTVSLNQQVCFQFRTSAYLLSGASIKQGSTPFGLGLTWAWITDLKAYAEGFQQDNGGLPLPARVLSYIVSSASDNTDNHTVNELRLGTSTGGYIDSQISTTTYQLLDGSKTTIRDLTASYASWLPDPFPFGDGVALTFRFDLKGTLYSKEENPVNVTVILSQLAAGWSAIFLFFNCFFPTSLVRMSTVHKLVAFVRLKSKKKDQELGPEMSQGSSPFEEL